MATQVTLGSGVVDSAAGLKLRTNGSTEAVDISTGQVVTLAKDAVVNSLTVGKGASSIVNNTAVGINALSAVTTADGSTGLGWEAAKKLTTGSASTAVGYAALHEATTGSGNSAFGWLALYGTTTGTNNVGIGVSALQANTTASNNTAVGYQAGYSNTTGSGNTSIGYHAGYSNTVGGRNVYIGTYAGEQANYTSGDAGNTYVGYQAGQNTTTGLANVLMGSNGSAQLGAAGQSLTTGIFNTFLGTSAGFYVTTGSKNTILGGYNGNQGGLDIRTASNYIVLSDGDGNPRLYYDSSSTTWKSVEIYNATTASGTNVAIAGNYGLYRVTSALKYKQDIRDVEDFDINALRPVRYKSKCEGDDQTKDHLGLIADEAAAAGFEELVSRNENGEIEGFQYDRLTVVLLKKLQVLEAEVKALKGQA